MSVPNSSASRVESDITAANGLLERAQTGDTEAFGEICRVYETPLLRHALSLTCNSALAEDLAQDTLVEAWRCLGRYNGRCQFFTWLCAILLNRFRNSLRQKGPIPLSALARHDHDEFQNCVQSLADPRSMPDEAAQLREQAALIQECVRALPTKHQQVIYLRFYVDDSLEGIAAALDCSVGTVKSRLFHALDKLRAMKALSARSEICKTKV